MEERKRKKRKKEEKEEEEEEEDPFTSLPDDLILFEILIHVEILFQLPMEISKKIVIKKTNFYFARDKHHENRRRYRFNNIKINGYSMTKIEFINIWKYISPKIKIISFYNCPFISTLINKFGAHEMDKMTIYNRDQVITDTILFKNDIFKNVKRIHFLDIRMNKLTGFKNATQLESIVLECSLTSPKMVLEAINPIIPIISMINDISGIKDCYNLKNIDLSALSITVFPYFQYFNEIVVIKINMCFSLLNISGLEILTNLRELSIMNCSEIVSYDSINKLVKLVNLTVSYCYMGNMDFVKTLNKLVILDLEGNDLTDIIPLKDLKKLNYLELSNNNLTDITPLKELTSINTLILSFNNIKDITPLKKLTLLSTLILSYNDINDISPLEKLINMKELQLDKNKISKFKVGIQHMTELQIIYMENNTTTESMEFLLDKMVFKKLIKVDFPRILTPKMIYSKELNKFQEGWSYSNTFNIDIRERFYKTR